MKKILLVLTLSVAILQSARSQNLPLIGLVAPGHVQNVLTSSSLTNNTRFMLRNSGMVPLQFYMASSATSQPASGTVAVAANTQVEVSVAQLGGISLGKSLNVSNAASDPDRMGLFNVLKTFPVSLPGTTPCLTLTGPQWQNNGLTGQNLFVCPNDALVGIGTQTPQANFHVTGTTRFDGMSQFGSNAGINGNLSVVRSLLVGTGLNVRYPATEFDPAIVANGYGRFGVDDNYIDIGSGAQYTNTANIQSHGTNGVPAPLQINYLNGGDIGLYGNVHIGAFYKSTAASNLILDGKLGMGTSSPVSTIDIQNNTGKTEIRMFSTATTVTPATYWAINNTYSFGFGIDANGVGNISSNVNGATQVMTFSKSGAVGIGTSATGTCKLAVEGMIGAREVRILASTTAFPDYVFDKNYKLITIAELEKFVNENHHLPEIPSAAEVKDNNGIDLGEMNVKLLKKVEELTLYMIEMKKENEEIKKENGQMQQAIKDLQSKK